MVIANNVSNIADVRPLAIEGALLAHNTGLNILGQSLPLLVGLVAVPIIIRGLGTDRFGLLALCWVVLGYFGMFDLGLGRATTKSVAELLGRGEIRQLPSLIGTCLLCHAVIGLLGGLILAGLAPLLAKRVLRIPSALIPEARIALWILAAAVPVVVLSAALRGALEAGQRFDLVNWIKTPANILVFLIPALSVPFGLGFRGIVLLIAMARGAAALLFLVYCYKAFPILKGGLCLDKRLIRSLLSFGGWVTVSNIVGPMVTYLDRFLVGSMLSLTAVAYYTAPYELVARIWILPWGLVSTLFPAFSVLSANGAHAELERIYSRSVKVLLLVVGPILLMIMLLAATILRVWLGNDFAMNSTAVLRILALGVFVVSMANVPFTFLQSLGRPDVPAKFHLFELSLYVGLAWLSIGKLGLVGAALAWCAIMSLDALLLFGAAWRLFGLSPKVLASNGVSRAVLAVAVPVAIILLLHQFFGSGHMAVHLVLEGTAFVAYAIIAWRYAMDATDRNVALAIAARYTNGIVRAR